MIVSAVAEQEKFEVSEEEISAEIENMTQTKRRRGNFAPPFSTYFLKKSISDF